MKSENLDYFCKVQAKLHGICIRRFKDSSLKTLTAFYGTKRGVSLNELSHGHIQAFKEGRTISFLDEKLFLLGTVQVEETGEVLLIGPARVGEITDSDISSIMAKYNLPHTIKKNIENFLYSTPLMILNHFFYLLSSFNLAANNKIVTAKSIMNENSDILSISDKGSDYIETVDIEHPRTNGQYEEAVIYYTKNGMVDEMKSLNFENYSGKIGELGPNQMRTIKNGAIILNSICLRAAISGGLDTETAYALGERYSQRIENAKSFFELGQLTPMIRNDYCQRVKDLTNKKIENVHIYKSHKYIQKNIYSKITVAELAEHVGIKPEYLSSLCKQNMNCTMTQYIMQRKISEAKKLLKFSDKSLLEISIVLCFSSQSHFQRQFKKICEITPAEYRKKNQKEAML